MRTTQSVAVAALAMGTLLGCTKQTSYGPVQWTASNPASTVGQTEAQAWSRSTSNDAREFTRQPPPITIVEPSSAGAQCEQPPGVTNLQPLTPRWPYDGVTLRLGPPPPPP